MQFFVGRPRVPGAVVFLGLTGPVLIAAIRAVIDLAQYGTILVLAQSAVVVVVLKFGTTGWACHTNRESGPPFLACQMLKTTRPHLEQTWEYGMMLMG